MVEGEIWLGVDFGTSNTVALIGRPGREPRPLLFDGSPLLPSAVCLDSSGRLLVGRDALHTAAAQPASLEPHPKRTIDDGSVLLGGHEIPEVDLIAAVLGRVAEEAVRVGEGYPTGTVLTCPSAWRERRRETLRNAADRVLPAVRLLTEPVAAAHYFVEVAGGRLPVGQCAVVYDFGAGTFDASVVRRTDHGFEVLASEGLADSGGLDIDAAIVGYLGASLGTSNVDLWQRLLRPGSTADRRASRQLWDNVRSAKEMLSRATRTLIYVPSLDAEAPLGREQLDELARPVLDRTVAATRTAIGAAGIARSEVVAVFLTGGSSRLTAVPTVVHRALGIVPTIVDQPELAVAEGAVRSLVSGLPVTGLPVPGRPVSGGPVSGLPVSGLPVSGPPVSGPPVSAAMVSAGLASAGPVPGAPGHAVTGYGVPDSGPLGPPSPVDRRRPWWLIGAAVLVVLVLVAGAALLLHPGHHPARLGAAASRTVSASPSGRPSATPGPLTGPACLIGTWTIVSRQSTVKINGSNVQIGGGAKEVDSYTADGGWTVNYNHSDPQGATVGGVRWLLVTRGIAKGHYDVQGDVIRYATSSVTGTWVWYRNGSRVNSGSMAISFAPERFVCNGNRLQQFGGTYGVDLARAGSD